MPRLLAAGVTRSQVVIPVQPAQQGLPRPAAAEQLAPMAQEAEPRLMGQPVAAQLQVARAELRLPARVELRLPARVELEAQLVVLAVQLVVLLLQPAALELPAVAAVRAW